MNGGAVSGGAVGTSRASVVKVLRSSAAASIVTGLVGVLVIPRIVHGLTLRRYGEWATLSAIIAIGQLTQAGAGVEVSRRVADAVGRDDMATVRRTAREAITTLGSLAAGLLAVTALAAGPLVRLVFAPVGAGERGQLVLVLVVVMAVFAVTLTVGALGATLAGLQRSDYVSWGSTAGLLLQAPSILVALHAGIGLWALVIGNAVAAGVPLVTTLVGVRRLVPGLRLLPTGITGRQLLSYVGMPAMVVMASASDLFDSQIDKLVLTHSVGPSAAAMFQIGVGVVQPARQLVLIPLGVLLAGTAELHRSDPGRLRALERTADRSVQYLAAIVAGGLVLFAGPFATVWLGRGFGDAALCIKVLAVAALINAWSAPWTFYALGRGRYHYVLVAAGVTVAVNLAGTTLLTATIGLDGALIGSVAGAAGGLLVGFAMLRRWDSRRWLAPGFRSTASIALLVVPVVVIGAAPPASWPWLVLAASAYLVAAGALLQLTRTSPWHLSGRGRRARVALRP